MFLGLIGEIGEILEKVNSERKSETANELTATFLHCGGVAKLIRKNPDHIIAKNALEDFKHFEDYVNEHRDDIMAEIGDCYWMLSGLTSVLSYDANDVAQHNLDKLASRQSRGVIDGNGDNR